MAQIYDIAIIGLGAMGSATAAFAASRGVKVLGIEAFRPAHGLSSSHGDTRLIRRAYFEDPAYVPLLFRAYENWRSLEARTQKNILTITGILHIGKPGSRLVDGALKSSELYNLSHEVFDRTGAASRYPVFQLDDDEVAVLDPEGGYLRPELAVESFIKLAVDDGAHLHFGERIRTVERRGAHLAITSDLGTYLTKKLVISAGAWIKQFVPQLSSIATPIRQVVAWYRPKESFAIAPDRMTGFLRDDGGPEPYFGFPGVVPDGVKVGLHCHFREPLDPDQPNADIGPKDTDVLDDFMARRLPLAAGARANAVTCRYTMLPSSDFLIDFMPDDKDVVVCSACSGHGFKFASVIGEVLTDLALDGETQLSLAPFTFDKHIGS